MKTIARQWTSVLLIGLGVAIARPANAQLTASTGYSFLRSSAIQNGSQNCFFASFDIGLPLLENGGVGGIFWQGNFATNTSGSSYLPMFYGFFLRALFGPKKKKSGFFEVRFDPISLIYVLIARGSNAVSIDQILSFGLNVGARIGLGKRAALMPYLGFSTYNFPYLGVVSGIYPRYYSPELGIKFALE